jgi:hypothetical protein
VIVNGLSRARIYERCSGYANRGIGTLDRGADDLGGKGTSHCRPLVETGDLANLVDGRIVGITTNPIIFAKAIGS